MVQVASPRGSSSSGRKVATVDVSIARDVFCHSLHLFQSCDICRWHFEFTQDIASEQIVSRGGHCFGKSFRRQAKHSFGGIMTRFKVHYRKYAAQAYLYVILYCDQWDRQRHGDRLQTTSARPTLRYSLPSMHNCHIKSQRDRRFHSEINAPSNLPKFNTLRYQGNL